MYKFKRFSPSLGAATTLTALVVVFSSLTIATAESNPGISLQSLLRAGRQNYPLLAKQTLLNDSLKLTQKKMNRAYWPQLSLNASASWQSDVIDIDIPIPGSTISPPTKDQYKATINLKQNIWDGGVTADQKRVAEKRSQIEHERVNLDWYQVRSQILQLYFAGVVQQELATQAETLDRYLGKVIDNAQVALRSGVATKRDVLLVKARQLEARQATIDAKSRLASVKRSLENLTGLAISADSQLATTFLPCPASEKTPPNPNTIHRPELNLLAAQTQLLEAQEKLEQATDRPKLGAFATAGYGRPGLNALNNNFDSYFIGGVQLTVPLTYIYSGTHSNTRRQLEIQRSLIARQQDVVMTQIQVKLDSHHAELNRLVNTIELDDQLLKVRQDARQETEFRLKLGTATMTDLVSDLSDEVRAQTQIAVHRAQLNLECHQLAFIKGDL